MTKEEAEKIVSDDAPDDPPLTDTDIDDETPIHEESDQLWAMATVSGKIYNYLYVLKMYYIYKYF